MLQHCLSASDRSRLVACLFQILNSINRPLHEWLSAWFQPGAAGVLSLHPDSFVNLYSNVSTPQGCLDTLVEYGGECCHSRAETLVDFDVELQQGVPSMQLHLRTLRLSCRKSSYLISMKTNQSFGSEKHSKSCGRRRILEF